MITHLTAGQLRRVAESGGALELDASQHTAPQLRSVATGSAAGKATLVLRNANALTAAEMVSIAAVHPGGVTFA